ncbi:hypothetical protein LEAN103870_06670 [Legionella anisa]|uniref:hypothetical protein n=1 Tax=Legionella anisa TaxID=28082 RepID=UPI00073C2F67|nr:hypothetical protein [Legionella anisa]KTC70081.1 hypothetical protein Lani_2422 [Legionella anisa]MBN5936553.1 hypothetical protein [Legionella anisa]UAK81533.1 hypothetical protein K8O89_18580 [Legionella anisa]
MIPSTTVEKTILLLLICISFLVSSCVSFVPQDDAKNNTPVKRQFSGYHPHGHGHGHH